MAMLDDNPILKERLMAFGAFSGIGLFAVTSVNLMISGGFDFGPGRAPYDREQPNAYVRMVDAAQYASDRVRAVSWDEPDFIGTADAATSEPLAGANDGSARQSETSDEVLYQEIAALYAGGWQATYAENPSYDDAEAELAYVEEFSPEEAAKVASVSGSASPW
jgi:hypothetical protein